MRTVICHFYNEEYLLPFWLRHHRNLFDHGIMINHHSDDNSINIIKELTPTWLIVNTKLTWFAAGENDKEVMNYEKTIIDWKIALNVTEFLLPAISMDEIQIWLIDNKLNMGKAIGYEMIDEDIINSPKLDKSLLLQKHYGCLDFTNERNRIFHRKEHGNYNFGRHFTKYGQQKFIPNLFLFHYGYCPWNEAFIKRKMQIRERIPISDYNGGLGRQHFRHVSEHNSGIPDRLARSHDLAKDAEIKLALDLVKSYY